ncbi:hypothetical protein EDD15DRAFT_2267537 [Pisolithus albus]|nr:hypothetical protein EDD15DRAFT_2267537 [Pisolithus albus]
MAWIAGCVLTWLTCTLDVGGMTESGDSWLCADWAHLHSGCWWHDSKMYVILWLRWPHLCSLGLHYTFNLIYDSIWWVVHGNSRDD